MKHFAYLLSLFFFSFISLLGAENIESAAPKLKEKQPDWKVEIIETYGGGNPKKVLYFSSSPKGKKQIEKRVLYYEDGKTCVEEDLIEKKNTEGEAEKVEYIPHGLCVSFYPNGAIEKEAILKEGKLHGDLKGFYPNGKEKFHFQFKNGQLHGSYISYYENGNVKEETIYEDGKILDTYAAFYENGQNASLKSYQNGVLEGASIEWHENGNLKSNHLFHKGLLHASGKAPALIVYDQDEKVVETLYAKEGILEGLHQKYYPNSVRRYQVNYINGKKEGKEEFFSETGAYLGGGEYQGGVPIKRHVIKYPNGLFQKIACYNEHGDLLKPIEEYHENGQIHKRYSLDKEGKREGPYLAWTDEGSLICEYIYKKGVFDGVQKEFFPSGQSKTLAHYQMGKQNGLFEQWYENGTRKILAHMVDDQKDGEYKTWYENGQLEVLENYVKGALAKNSKSWYANGQLKQFNQYKEGKPHGEHKAYSEKGQLLIDIQYVDGLKEGLCQSWYPNGVLREKAVFLKGKKEGLEETFYEDGTLMTSFYFSGGLKNGPFLTWFEDGKPHVISEFKMGMPVGDHKEFYSEKEGKHVLKAEAHYKNHKHHGRQIEYYKNGQKKATIDYVEGKVSGIKKNWDESGLVLEEIHYKNNELEGPFFLHHKDGSEEEGNYKKNLKEGKYFLYYPKKEGEKRTLALEAQYHKDQLHGLVKEYHSSGKLVAITPYKNNKKEGEAKIYDLTGTLRMTAEYKNGINDGITKLYFPNGALSKETTYVKGAKEGKENTYIEDGKLVGQNHYKQGVLDGYIFTKNKDGVLTFEGEYQMGKRHGKFNKFYDSGDPKIVQFFVDDKLHGSKKVYTLDGEVKELKYDMGEKVK